MSRSVAQRQRSKPHAKQATAQRESARSVALRVLHRVETQGAYANFALASAFERHPLDRRDRALVEELVYGVLRRRNTLDWLLEKHTRRPLANLDAWVHNILRIGAYQAWRLEHVPDYALVNDAVQLARWFRGEAVTGFVNAVLRSLLRWLQEHNGRRAGDSVLISAPEDAAAGLSINASHPLWVVRRWVGQWGVEEAARLCAANNEVPPLSVRVNTLRASVAEVQAALEAEGCGVAPGRLHPQALLLDVDRNIRDLECFRAGLFFVQDESSMAAVRLLGLQPGMRVLDACAGRGGKTASIAMELCGKGSITCWDRRGAQIARLAEECRRLGIEQAEPVVADASQPREDVGKFDAVLVDAPCSGLGVVRRYPDVRWRRLETDLERLRQLQVSLITSVAERLRPGGVLVYAVCSTEPEETTQVIEQFLRQRPDADVLDAGKRLAGLGGESPGGETPWGEYLLTLPHRHGADGFFAAAIQLTNADVMRGIS